ncbi:unnamed protein product [Clonostachys rosea]|uniref:NmrA-like domain-containing protein n=1 Tax=Bionectria ochroleuca TaxID=29856 RepID=A0ABY6UGD3_BIOOC|nr:unnamed protein product [Clonostachys rosea]
MAPPKVIVFGPAGAAGSATARTAYELGAEVVLAMRDIEKPVPGFDAAKEHRGVERVYADLLQPDTVHSAVSTTGAKSAFIYIAHRSPDHMKSTIGALKSAGIELVVFLSSFTVQGDPRTIAPSEVIPYMHGQVEINLREVFGPDGYVAVKPGSFASNTRQYKAGIQEGEVSIMAPDATVDCVAPEDIGRVCGTVLTKGAPGDDRVLYLYGPQLLTHEDCVQILANALGKNPKVKALDKADAYKMFNEQRGFPPTLAEYMVRQGSLVTPGQQSVFGYPVSDDQLSNVEKYSGKKATTFEEWVEQNKDMFIS